MQLWMHQPVQMLSGSLLDHLISGLHDVGCQRASRKRRVKPEHFFLRATSMIYEALADFLQGLRLDLSPSNRKVTDKLWTSERAFRMAATSRCPASSVHGITAF